jgi:SAM-dependent methyltransferase
LATDIDPRFLVTLNLPNVEARQHDILNDELPEGAFDLVHARAVLEHLPARQEALRRLVTALKPGGWLLVEDADFVSFVPGSGDDNDGGALFRKCWAAIQAAREARGAAADYGRQLYGAFLAQGLVDVGAVGRVAVAQGGSALSRIPRLTAEQLQQVMLNAGLVSEQELQRYFALLDDPDFTWLMPIMIAVWGRRPRV